MPRDDVDVSVSHRLASRPTIVNSDIEAGDPEMRRAKPAHCGYQFPHSVILKRSQVENRLDVSARDNENMPIRYWILVRNGDSVL